MAPCLLSRIRHVELRDEEELYKLIRRERKIDIPTPPERTEKQKKRDEEVQEAITDISHLAYVDTQPLC